jgi:hypothetical protein
MFLRIGTFAEWSLFTMGVAGWYLKMNIDQKKIENNAVPRTIPEG